MKTLKFICLLVATVLLAELVCVWHEHKPTFWWNTQWAGVCSTRSDRYWSLTANFCDGYLLTGKGAEAIIFTPEGYVRAGRHRMPKIRWTSYRYPVWVNTQDGVLTNNVLVRILRSDP